jgi:hypothetical protein
VHLLDFDKHSRAASEAGMAPRQFRRANRCPLRSGRLRGLRRDPVSQNTACPVIAAGSHVENAGT